MYNIKCIILNVLYECTILNVLYECIIWMYYIKYIKNILNL